MRAGFTLVELAIVLVILGLITGGILSGKSLIRASQVRSISTDFSRYDMAVNGFVDQYAALPGDMSDATEFWTAAHGTHATCVITPAVGTETCNGDGNGFVSGAAVTLYNEQDRFWQHLANAGLIEGKYTGANATYSGHSTAFVAGVNMPALKIDATGFWIAAAVTAFSGSTSIFAYPAGNMLRITSNITPKECWNIDNKIDDGRPATGYMMSNKGTAASPTTTVAGQPTSEDHNAAYNLAVNSAICNPRFLGMW